MSACDGVVMMDGCDCWAHTIGGLILLPVDSPVSGSIESMRYMVPQVYIMPLAFAVLAVRSMGTATTQPAGIQAVDTKEVVAS